MPPVETTTTKKLLDLWTAKCYLPILQKKKKKTAKSQVRRIHFSHGCHNELTQEKVSHCDEVHRLSHRYHLGTCFSRGITLRGKDDRRIPQLHHQEDSRLQQRGHADQCRRATLTWLHANCLPLPAHEY